MILRLKEDEKKLNRIVWEFILDEYAIYKHGPYSEVFAAPSLNDITSSLTATITRLKRHSHGKTVRDKHLATSRTT